MSLRRVAAEKAQDQQLLTEMVVYLLRVGYRPDTMCKQDAKLWRKQVIEGIRIAREVWQPHRWSFYCNLPLAVSAVEFFELGWP